MKKKKINRVKLTDQNINSIEMLRYWKKNYVRKVMICNLNDQLSKIEPNKIVFHYIYFEVKNLKLQFYDKNIYLYLPFNDILIKL